MRSFSTTLGSSATLGGGPLQRVVETASIFSVRLEKSIVSLLGSRRAL